MIGDALPAIVHRHGHSVNLEGKAVPLDNRYQGIYLLDTAVESWRQLPGPQWIWRALNIGIVFQHLVVTLPIDHKGIAIHLLTVLPAQPQAEGQPVDGIETSRVLYYLCR